MKHLSHLKALQALEATIRLGTLKKAADELYVTAAAVGQRISTLETYLGVQLLDRGPRGAMPTLVAREAIKELTSGFRMLEVAAEKLQFKHLNEVYIRADPDWSELWLAPRLAAFQEAHPSITILLQSDSEAINKDRTPDFHISYAAANADISSTILFHEYLVPVTSPLNQERISKLPRDKCLEGFPLLHLLNQIEEPKLFGWREWVKQFGLRKKVTGRGIQYERTSTALRAIRTGSDAGFLICGLSLINEEIKTGELRVPFEIEKGAWAGFAYHLHSSEDTQPRRQILLFQDWLLQEARKTDFELRSICPEMSNARS
jgi:LysR family glycine cleavage system transcriptional activator